MSLARTRERAAKPRGAEVRKHWPCGTEWGPGTSDNALTDGLVAREQAHLTKWALGVRAWQLRRLKRSIRSDSENSLYQGWHWHPPLVVEISTQLVIFYKTAKMWVWMASLEKQHWPVLSNSPHIHVFWRLLNSFFLLARASIQSKSKFVAFRAILVVAYVLYSSIFNYLQSKSLLKGVVKRLLAKINQ